MHRFLIQILILTLNWIIWKEKLLIRILILQKYRQNPDNLLKCGVQNYRTLTLCLNPYEENNEMLKKLGFSNSEISNRWLVQNKIERYIVKHGNFAYTKTDTQQNISLIMLSTLFSLMDADEFILNIVLKNVINNLNYIDHEY